MNTPNRKKILRAIGIIFAILLMFYCIQYAMHSSYLPGNFFQIKNLVARLRGSKQPDVDSEPVVIPSILRHLQDGYGYRISKVNKSAPLAIVFSLDKEFSFDRRYVPVSEYLEKAGFVVASMDVPCHGDDRSSEEILLKNGIKCLRERSEKNIDYLHPFILRTSQVIDDIAANNLAQTQAITVVGISRGAFVGMWASLSDRRITNIVALAPLVEMMNLTEFDGYKGNQENFNFDGHFKALSEKNIFLQVANRDDRIGTVSVMKFAEKISFSKPESQPINFTLVMTPQRGHKDSLYMEASVWALKQFKQQIMPN